MMFRRASGMQMWIIRCELMNLCKNCSEGKKNHAASVANMFKRTISLPGGTRPQLC